MIKALSDENSKIHTMITEIFTEATDWYNTLVIENKTEWASHETWDLMKTTIRNELKNIDNSYRLRRKIKIEKSIEILKMTSLITENEADRNRIISEKLEAMK